MRRFKAPSPAMVVALVALFVALGGTGYAAREAFSPTKPQIIRLVKGLAPKLSVKSLTTLASGASESGTFAGANGNGADSGYIGIAINYAKPLPTAIDNAHIIDVHGTSASFCPGAGHAAPGYLCLYNTDETGLDGYFSPHSNDGTQFPISLGKQGVMIYWGTNSGAGYVGGSWTVTAP